uniref:Uncharacterized protein n=1 Tax=viral metagenome TaxID=1070528 RepID=A0A6C0ESL2_9ZZZZ
MIPDCTLVTGCFNLTDIYPKSRGLNECINEMKPILEINCYLVIFADSKCMDEIRKYRTNLNLNDITYYVEIELQDFTYYNYVETIRQNRELYHPTKDERTCPESHLICCSKFDFVLQAMKLNPFNTSKYGWLDANVKDNFSKICKNYTKNTIIDILNNVTDKFHIEVLNVCDKKYKNIENKREYYQTYRYVVCGGLFTTGKIIGEKILKRLCEIFVETTKQGYGHGEEMFYLEVLDEFYDDIERSYGDYHIILNNFIYPTKEINYIINYILNKYIHYGYYRECYDACNKILNGLTNDTEIICSDDEYFTIVLNLYISSCYYKPDKSINILNTIYELIHKNEYIQNKYNNNKLYYDSKFKFAEDLKEKYDIILCVFGCPTIEKYKNQILKINETWGKIADSLPNIKLLYFFGEEKTELIDDNKYIYLDGVGNDYLSSSYKHNLGLKYIFENYNSKFVFVCGTDTYINIYKLLNYTKQLNEDDKLFIGGHGDYRLIDNKNYYFHSGAGYILSKECLKYLYPQLSTITDLWINKCKNDGLPDHLITGCDVCISYYLQNKNYLTDDTIIKRNDLFAGCNYVGCHSYGICCGEKIKKEDIISCHFMTLSDFDVFTELLNQNNYFVSSENYVEEKVVKVENEIYKNSINYIKNKYEVLCNTCGDINEHLPTLNKYAMDCESILELGVRGCVSSWANLYGLINNKKDKKLLFLNDISPCPVDELLNITKELDFVQIKYEWVNDLHLTFNEPTTFDLTFIDTWHVYPQLKGELNKFSKITNKYIIMHDTEVDGIYGETIRNGWNPFQQSQETGFAVNDITCGLKRAIDEFLSENNDWKIKEIYTNNNGLTILQKI